MGRGGATIAAGEGRQVSVAVRGGIVLAGGQGERAGATEESAGSAGLSSQQKDGRRSATWDRARNGTPPRRKLTWGGGSRCCSCYPWGKMDTGRGEGGFRVGEWRRQASVDPSLSPGAFCQCTRRPSTEIFFSAVRGSGLRHLRGVALGIQHRRRRKQSQRGGGRREEAPGEGGAKRGDAVEEGGSGCVRAQRVRAVMSVTEKVGMVSRVSGPVGYVWRGVIATGEDGQR